VDESLKRRLVGAVVLVCLVVIFVPMLLDDGAVPELEIQGSNIPPRPPPGEGFDSGQILPLDEDPMALPPEPPLLPPRPAALEIEPLPLPEPIVPAPESAPTTAAEPEAKPVPMPRPEPLPEPKPKPKPKPEPEPKPEPAPKPRPVPEPAPKPVPTPKPTLDQPAAQAPSLSAWVVQVASLSSSERADQLVAELREAKYPAFREPVRIDDRTLHRVRIGPEADRRLAEAMAAGVNKRFDLKSKVVSYP